MSKIKFRQILKPSLRAHSGSFHYWGYIDNGFRGPVGKNHFVEGSKDQQYSGLKDKNGVDIYEGDVVRLAGYGDYIAKFPFIDLYEAGFESDIGAIKGNIYENPEYND